MSVALVVGFVLWGAVTCYLGMRYAATTIGRKFGAPTLSIIRKIEPTHELYKPARELLKKLGVVS